MARTALGKNGKSGPQILSTPSRRVIARPAPESCRTKNNRFGDSLWEFSTVRGYPKYCMTKVPYTLGIMVLQYTKVMQDA